MPPGARPDLVVIAAAPEEQRMLEANAAVIAHTLRSGDMTFSAVPAGGRGAVRGGGG